MYDGRCHAEFTFALCQLSALCTQLGIAVQIYFASGEALVMKARNAIADHFLQSDATHLMLIDSDIGFPGGRCAVAAGAADAAMPGTMTTMW